MSAEMGQITSATLSPQETKEIKKERLNFTKNTISSGLALLAIVFNVLYFVSIYRSDVGNYYYSWVIGLSVLTNLVFMLVTFLCEEGVKKYKLSYSILMLIIGVIQIARIFILPLDASRKVINEIPVMTTLQYNHVVAYLIISAVCLFVGGVVGIIKSKQLADYQQAKS